MGSSHQPKVIIEGYEAWALRAPVNQFADARNLIDSRDVLWLRLHFSDGSVGWGEATIFGGPAEVAGRVLTEELFSLIAGESGYAIHRLWDKIYQTTFMHGRRGVVICGLSALDVALWDGLARRADLPLVDVLGRYTDRVYPYASAGFYDVGKELTDLVSEIESLYASGFRAFKIKVGRQRRQWADIWSKDYSVSLDEDVMRVLAVRDAIGHDSLLLIDANTEWDPPTAVEFLKRIESAKIFFLEEPVSSDHGHLAAEIRKRTNVRVAGFETEYTRYAYRDLLAMGALDVVQPDACWCGGISEARRIAALASAEGRLCVPHSLSSALSFHVNAHLVASLDNGFLVEWDCTGNPFVDRYMSPTRLQDGWLELPNGSGIGFTPDPDEFAEFVAEKWSAGV